MQKEKKDKHFIKKPIYEGGPKELKKFIRKNLKYPKKAFENKIEGTVFLNYTIDHKGNVIEAKIISGVGYDCDEEAIRLAKLLKFKVPKTRGVKVRYHKNIQIHFRLPKKKAKPASNVQYKITPSKKEKGKEPITKTPEKKKSYTYTIRIN